jgi:hypothetical protein
MGKIRQIAEGAFFVPSYSEQTIQRAYSTQTTIQSFGPGDESDEESREYEERGNKEPPGFPPERPDSGS